MAPYVTGHVSYFGRKAWQPKAAGCEASKEVCPEASSGESKDNIINKDKVWQPKAARCESEDNIITKDKVWQPKAARCETEDNIITKDKVWKSARCEASKKVCPEASSGESEDNIITKEQFMGIFALMALPKRGSLAKRLDDVCVHPDRSDVPSLLSPPPGLAPPLRERAQTCPSGACDSSSVSPSGSYQVLIRGLPDTFMYDNVITSLLQAAGLEDGMRGLSIRPTGKVLITFSTIELVDECIRYLHDPEWNVAGFSLSALYVQTVKRSPVFAPTPVPEQESNPYVREFAFDARSPVFEPTIAPEQESNLYPPEFSLDAPAIVPDALREFAFDARSPVFEPTVAPDQESNLYPPEFSLDAPAFVPAPKEKDCEGYLGSPLLSKKLSPNAAEFTPASPGLSTTADDLSDSVSEGFELDCEA